MSIIRAPRPESNFYMLDKAISEDKSLGWAARGLLIFLLGKPDHWSVSVQALVNEVSGSTEVSGRDRTYALINQLIKAGYIVRQQGKGEAGKFASYDYLVSEVPCTDSPLPAQPDTAQPLPANPTLVSIEDKQGLNGASTEGRKAPVAKFNPLPARPENVTEPVWAEWCQFRKEIRKPLTETMCRQQAKTLQGLTNADAVILKSIANGWTGLFPEKSAPRQRHHGLAELDYGGGSDSPVQIGGL